MKAFEISVHFEYILRITLLSGVVMDFSFTYESAPFQNILPYSLAGKIARKAEHFRIIQWNITVNLPN